ncbi:hypothetical protein Ctob_006987 [Chrysochromulina tobinii]|uniref:Uncharacterized protein n=1 Tax=Chrysochromulina tobinii TaxID=1460289 RepID=A0A0M0JYH0_9EUKA|nr:hypothetical protein Ctob_006987 [Chrysochromulina tobinii]|eukprot:KOO31178.1 hypothetical protein Ctob_006987 [Chrysochromulina sp. CCMP291]
MVTTRRASSCRAAR